MYIRLVHGQPRPGQAQEVARRWKEHLAPRLRKTPGFRAGYFVGDVAADKVIGITIWDEKPGAAVDEAMAEFRQLVGDITTGPPAGRDDLMVLAEA
jgi:hypothetical protein